MSPYGKKGGTSVNAGRKASTYEATLPNGTVVRKRAFGVESPTAYIAYFKRTDGSFLAVAVVEKVTSQGAPIYGTTAVPGQMTVAARRLR